MTYAVRFMLPVVFCVCSLGLRPAAAQPGSAPATLTIVSAGPAGEVASLAEANEVRVVFSEPMVTLGRVPDPVRVPFFRISPAVSGTFRWSGTTLLIFTPDPKRPLPYATRYEVTIDTTAVAISGRRLARPFSFGFTTPPVKLLQTNWYRRGGRADAPVVVLLRFNQPVRAADIAAHLSAAFEPHTWVAPAFPAAAAARLNQVDAAAVGRFQAKVNATRAVAEASSAVTFRLTDDWDRKMFPPAPNMVALENASPIPSESWVKLVLGPQLPSPAGTAVPGAPQSYTLQVEPAFFIDGFHCPAQCDPDQYNPIEMRTNVRVSDFAAAVTVTDLTFSAAGRDVEKRATPRPRRTYELDETRYLTLDDAGFDTQPPARTYAVTIRGDLRAADGQTLGYTWVGTVENWHQRAFTSFGDGHGVWETGGGSVLPFYARNFRNVRQWAVSITPDDLMRTLQALQPRFNTAPAGTGIERRLGGTADRVQSHGLDMSSALAKSATGLVWAAVQEGEPIESSRPFGEARVRASLVQVTNLGITVKDSPLNTLVFVTRLDNGEPVAGARVSIVRPDSSVFWTGTTDSDGLAVAPETPLRDADEWWWKFAFIVTAEKDGDVAYAGSDWHEGILPWEFGLSVNLQEASPLLRGSVFSDRGVYRLGEEVHIKAILRYNSASGIRLLEPGTAVFVSLRDSQDRVVDERTVKVNAWSSADWKLTLPGDGALGNYQLQVMLEVDRPRPKAAENLRPGQTPGPEADRFVPDTRVVNGSFLVAAYRRPDFRVDVALTGSSLIAGDELKGTVTARYLFGAPMGNRPLGWAFSKQLVGDAPAPVRRTFPSDRWLFVGWSERSVHEAGEIRREVSELTGAGQREVQLATKRDAGVPYSYTFEGDVEDVSRQHIANRASVVVHPAPWYVGVRRPSYFVEQKTGLSSELVTVSPDGHIVPGVPVTVTLTQVQWIGVRRAEGNGFYTWDTERKEIPAGSWTITTAEQPVPLDIPLANGGYFLLEAVAREEGGRFAVTRTSFYALGEGYTAWARFDHHRIELVPERSTYKPGETARIMIQSPWERATALVTTEREGIRSHRRFTLTSTQESVAVPISEHDIPNVYVSVLLIKGRTAAAETSDAAPQQRGPTVGSDPSDPGKPAFRLGYVELKVEDATKRLTVAVSASKPEYRPANTATVNVTVKDHQGHGSRSEVTLWAVDYGVLSLTAYRTPDVVGSVYVHKSLQVLTTDNRQRIISRRVLTPKGDTDGGGGGGDPGAGTLRKDFRILAFWLGSVITDGEGAVAVDVRLPESLTTYRIMAVAADRSSRFGAGDAEVRVNKPLTLNPAFPRFLALGDTARFGAVVTSQLPSPAPATVTIRSLDPDVVDFTGAPQLNLQVAAGGSAEVRFDAAARRIGRARVQMTVKAAGESDAFEDVIPVEVLVSPETVAAYGEANDAAPRGIEVLSAPEGVVPAFGGLHVEMSSTAMVGLGEGARYLVEYPYGCAEQRASRTLAMLLAADLGDAFSLPGLEAAKLRPAAQENLKELERYQCPNGGFALWPGNCSSVSPYLTSYVLHIFKTAGDLQYAVSEVVRQRAYTYLEREMAAPPPTNESWWPSYTAWQAFAVKVLVDGGRNQDSNLNRLYGYRERMPVFALAYLHDALLARPDAAAPQTAARLAELRRRMANAILPEGGGAHVEELSDPYLLWFWNSNVRSTAIVLNTFVRSDVPDAPIRQMVRWMMAARKDGRWGTTQENAHAMEALVAYYRRHEVVVPDFSAVVALGSEELAREEFKGRSTASITREVAMPRVLSSAPAGESQPLIFTKEGAGTLFYTARLKYAVDRLFQEGLDSGMHIVRSYAPFVEGGARPSTSTFEAGELVRVTLTLQLTKERRFVAVTDPLPAGFEAVESWFATTAKSLASRQDDQGEVDQDWLAWWRRGGFDHVERHDNRVQLFATRLSEGTHEFSYIARATTTGTFRTAPARAEEMYEPEVFGRTGTTVIEIKR